MCVCGGGGELFTHILFSFWAENVRKFFLQRKYVEIGKKNESKAHYL